MDTVEYWRFPSYPFDALEAVLEFKVRVKGNLDNIFEDIHRLDAFHRENPNYVEFLVVLDSAAGEDDMKKIDAYLGERRSCIYLCRSSLSRNRLRSSDVV